MFHYVGSFSPPATQECKSPMYYLLNLICRPSTGTSVVVKNCKLEQLFLIPGGMKSLCWWIRVGFKWEDDRVIKSWSATKLHCLWQQQHVFRSVQPFFIENFFVINIQTQDLDGWVNFRYPCWCSVYQFYGFLIFTKPLFHGLHGWISYFINWCFKVSSISPLDCEMGWI